MNNEFVAEELEKMLSEVKSKISLNCLNLSESDPLNSYLQQTIIDGITELMIEEYRLENAIIEVKLGEKDYKILPQNESATRH